MRISEIALALLIISAVIYAIIYAVQKSIPEKKKKS